MKKTIKLLWALLPIFTFASCYDYPDELDQAEEQLVAITRYDTKITTNQWKSYETFYIPDSIVVIKDKNTTQTVANAYTAQTIAKIRSNMESRGYVYQPYNATSKPDLAVTVYAFEVTNISADYYPGWWYGYDYYYWYWDWDPYYYYYPYTFVTSYSVGTMGIEIADIKNPSQSGQYPVIWMGVVRGVLDGGHTQSEINRTIDECFNQVPSNVLRVN